jgi:hypothetical protein
MSFSAEVKTLMFVRCGRLCCLCLKQCGVNIEAAHIRAEGKGGSNDEENGIPVCFDCHQEMESYNDDHPKGNKFRPAELIARRDRVYRLVESGSIYAQVVARCLRRSSLEPTDAEIDESVSPPVPTAEEKRLLEMLASELPPEAPDRKIKLLSPKGQAFVLDGLLKEAPARPTAVTALCRAATRNLLSEDDQRVTVEQLVRAVTLFGTPSAKAALFETLTPEVFGQVDEELRLALFDDAIHIIKRDQFDEVNKLVPALQSHIAAVPSELRADFVMALLDQGRSRSHQGAPSARRMLASLPEEMAKPALPRLDRKFLEWYGREKFVRAFVRDFGKLADPKQRPMLNDLLTLSDRDFRDKYCPDDL